MLKDGEYARQGSEDDRFVDYFGTIQSIVTSSGNNDSGMFETNLRDERFLPFEGAGAESTWKLELPARLPPVRLQHHLGRDPAHPLHRPSGRRATADEGGREHSGAHRGGNTAGLTLLFSLKHEFPNEWHRFIGGTGSFEATVKRDHFPYFTRGREIAIDSVKLHAIKMDQETFKVESNTPPGLQLMELTNTLNDASQAAFVLSLPEDPVGPDAVLERKKDAIGYVSIKYSLTL